MKDIDNEINKILSKPPSYYYKKIRNSFPVFNFGKYKQVLLFGAGYAGEIFINLCRKNKIDLIAICDNDKSKMGGMINGVKIISIKELKRYPKSTPIVVTIMHDYIVKEQLRRLGFFNVWNHAYFSIVYPKKFDNQNWYNSIEAILNSKSRIISTLKLFMDYKSKQTFLEMIKYRLTLRVEGLKKIAKPVKQQYFEPSLIKIRNYEIFFDGGAYIGDTISFFLKYSDNKFKKIICFEPDHNSFNKLRDYVKDLKDKRITILPYALGKANTLKKFNYLGTAASRISKKGKDKIKVVSLDNYFKYKPTFIKMDIEGFEREALMGSRKILTQLKPKLAICIYHKPSDLWEIPNLIIKLNPNYHLYIRQYSVALHDTICYAI